MPFEFYESHVLDFVRWYSYTHMHTYTTVISVLNAKYRPQFICELHKLVLCLQRANENTRKNTMWMFVRSIHTKEKKKIYRTHSSRNITKVEMKRTTEHAEYRLFVYLFVCWLAGWLVCLFVCLFVRSFVCLLVCPFDTCTLYSTHTTLTFYRFNHSLHLDVVHGIHIY